MLERLILKIIFKTKQLSAVAPMLVKLTAKSKERLHPKHLIPKQKLWFFEEIAKGE